MCASALRFASRVRPPLKKQEQAKKMIEDLTGLEQHEGE